MRKNSNSVGDRINKFDNLEHQTVATFNGLFPECKIPTTTFDEDFEVMIGGLLPNNKRDLLIEGVRLEHKMFSDILYTLDRDDYNNEEKELDEMYGHPV